jgi:hypothetical protein
MGSLFISEYELPGAFGARGAEQLWPVESIAEQRLEVTGSSLLTRPFTGKTKVIRIVSSSPCHFKVGAPGEDPTATQHSRFLPPHQIEFYAVQPGHRLAVVGNDGH